MGVEWGERRVHLSVHTPTCEAGGRRYLPPSIVLLQLTVWAKPAEQGALQPRHHSHRHAQPHEHFYVGAGILTPFLMSTEPVLLTTKPGPHT